MVSLHFKHTRRLVKIRHSFLHIVLDVFLKKIEKKKKEKGCKLFSLKMK